MKRNTNHVPKLSSTSWVSDVSENRLKGSWVAASRSSITLMTLLSTASSIKPRALVDEETNVLVKLNFRWELH